MPTSALGGNKAHSFGTLGWCISVRARDVMAPESLPEPMVTASVSAFGATILAAGVAAGPFCLLGETASNAALEGKTVVLDVAVVER